MISIVNHQLSFLNPTMKFTVAFALLIVAASAAVLPKSNDEVQILTRSFENDGNLYKFGFEQSDGQKRDEAGEVKLIGKESGIVMRGSYSFVGDDGQTYTVTYIADENVIFRYIEFEVLSSNLCFFPGFPTIGCSHPCLNTAAVTKIHQFF